MTKGWKGRLATAIAIVTAIGIVVAILSLVPRGQDPGRVATDEAPALQEATTESEPEEGESNEAQVSVADATPDIAAEADEPEEYPSKTRGVGADGAASGAARQAPEPATETREGTAPIATTTDVGGKEGQPSTGAGPSRPAQPAESPPTEGGTQVTPQEAAPPSPAFVACATCGGTGVVTTTVMVSEAWEEPVYDWVWDCYVCSDGHVCRSDEELEQYLYDRAVAGEVVTSSSHYEQVVVGTVEHPAQYEERTVACPACGGAGGGCE